MNWIYDVFTPLTSCPNDSTYFSWLALTLKAVFWVFISEILDEVQYNTFFWLVSDGYLILLVDPDSPSQQRFSSCPPQTRKKAQPWGHFNSVYRATRRDWADVLNLSPKRLFCLSLNSAKAGLVIPLVVSAWKHVAAVSRGGMWPMRKTMCHLALPEVIGMR